MPRPPAESTPSMPLHVGRYELLLPIASGGMATVYLARASGFGGFERQVALKLTHAHLRDLPHFAVDILEEAKLAARVRHPNVVPVLDVGDDPNGVFLVMEYIEGDSLSGLLRRAHERGEKIPLPVTLRILTDALAGLHAAHELKDERGRSLGVVHRDFSPQNILVGTDGIARLTDFGVAKAATRLGHTRTGLVKGKLSYMSPEQARGQTIDRRCDVWAAGVIAWESLAMRRLYRGDNDVATILRLVSEPPPRLSSVVPDIPPPLDDAVASALEHDIQKRCPSAAELSRRLREALGSHGPLAETAEVAEIVAQHAGPKLDERRARAEEACRLRSRMGELVGSATMPVAAESSASASDREVEIEPPTERISGSGGAVASSGTEQPSTDTTSSVGTGARATPRPRRWVWAISVANLALLLVATVLFLRARAGAGDSSAAAPSSEALPAVSSATPPEPSTTIPEPARASEAPPESPPTISEPARTRAPSAFPPAASASAASSSSAGVKSRPAGPHGSPARPTTPLARPTTVLPANPYGK